MSPGIHNIEMHKGTRFNLSIVFKDGDGNPVDLTNRTAKMDVRLPNEPRTPLVSLSSDRGNITLTSQGEITIEAGASLMNRIRMDPAARPLKAAYDLLLYDRADPDNVICLLEGEVTILAGVTR